MTAKGQVLETRIVLSDSIGIRQVWECKDREGTVRRIAAYTNSRAIPGAAPGKVLRWTNPRYHNFIDGSSGARLEEQDLVNVKVSDT